VFATLSDRCDALQFVVEGAVGTILVPRLVHPNLTFYILSMSVEDDVGVRELQKPMGTRKSYFRPFVAIFFPSMVRWIGGRMSEAFRS
jgi:hypothetical protein